MKKTIKVLAAPCYENGKKQKLLSVDVFPLGADIEENEHGYYEMSGDRTGDALTVSYFPELAVIKKPAEITITFEIEREKGHYWVKMEQGADWVVAKWNARWWVPGNGLGFQDRDLIEIDENRIERAQE